MEIEKLPIRENIDLSVGKITLDQTSMKDILVKEDNSFVLFYNAPVWSDGDTSEYYSEVELTMKNMTSSGEVLSTKVLSDSTCVTRAILTEDGGYLLATKKLVDATLFGGNESIIMLYKIDSESNTLWTKTLDPSFGLEVKNIKQSTSGLIYLVTKHKYGGDKIWRFSSNGNLISQVEEIYSEVFTSPLYGDITINNDQRIVVSIYTDEIVEEGTDGWSILYPTVFEPDSVGKNIVNSILYYNQNGQEGYLVLGTKAYLVSEGPRILLQKLDISGNLISEVTYSIDYSNSGYSIIKSADGNFFISSLNTGPTGTVPRSFHCQKISLDGDVLASGQAYSVDDAWFFLGGIAELGSDHIVASYAKQIPDLAGVFDFTISIVNIE